MHGRTAGLGGDEQHTTPTGRFALEKTAALTLLTIDDKLLSESLGVVKRDKIVIVYVDRVESSWGPLRSSTQSSTLKIEDEGGVSDVRSRKNARGRGSSKKEGFST